ncbi:Hypothetical predicted protein [Cloeon dipterum]|uniref:Ubiquitin carboxyl-terminal hydrolase n=1 Tax=Cloeon dipterum TaxID=197152 RepID=A0A8S1BT67_9INSE|nr:Hypothetical predicted protein [Cloeon dipterum]
MECPHLDVGAEVEAAARSSAAAGGGKCDGCDATQSLWLCLTCGALNCGRYVAGHAKAHYEDTGHATALDWTALSVYCYTCDEYAVNDNQRLTAVRAARSAPAPRRSLRPRKPAKRSPTGRQEENEEEEVEETATKRPKEVRVVGLRNLGNTCFMNAVLQSLSNIQEFCGYFKKLPALEAKDGRGRLAYRNLRYDESDSLMTEELRKVLVSLDSGDKAAISPESLFSVIWKVVPRFRGYQQQDAHEFLRYMLDRLHTELLTLLPNEPANHSIVTSVFGGTLQSEVHCLTCGTDSKKHDPFLDLSLDVPDRFLPNRTKSKENTEECAVSCHLEDCLKSFVEVEELAESELYYCSSCKSKQRSTKRFWIRRLPNVLCLHIKRFRWSFCARTKLDTYISFPLHALDMSQFVLGQPDSHLYDLAAVIVHHGSGAGSGHYTAFAVNKGHWFHFNDSTVRAVASKEVEKCKSYILFYIRQEFRLPPF